MTVIAMTQEMGSLGKDVALGLADALGLSLVRDEIAEHVAQELKTHTSVIGRYLEGQTGLRERLGTSRRSLAVYSAEEVFEHAAKDNVLIRGWGGSYLLRPVKHVLSVRVCATFEQRVKWLMERLNTDDQKFAQEEIRRSDATRTAHIRRLFNKTWGDPLDYDVVLNTGRVSVENCIEVVKVMVRLPEFQPTTKSLNCLANLTLAANVRAALRRDPSTEHSQISVEADDCKVTLSGTVVDEEEGKACETAAANVQGVREVDCQLTVMSRFKTFY